jgi:molybdopterin molybdotransferase
MRRDARENVGVISLDDARAAVVAAVRPLEAERVAIRAARGRVLAEDVTAGADVPPFANSAMDGFAVLAGPAGRELRVVDESRAGRPARRAVAEGEAIRISTGAPIPEGATAVVPVELVAERDGMVVPQHEVRPHANIRDAGEDLPAGTVVVARGTRLGAGELAAAVGAGRAELRCARRPRVALLATGDELVPAGAPLAPGQIHNSNAVALAALAEREGAEVVLDEVVPDDRARTDDALARALGAADVVAVSGGVSVGPHDHVKPALASAGVEKRFWRVALKPGKPAWFGQRADTLAFGLPGNPVSAVVCFLLLVRPALRGLQGAEPLAPRSVAVLAEPIRRSPDREQAVRVRLRPGDDGMPRARPTGAQGSHLLSSLVGADGLAMVPAGEGELEAGARVAIEPVAA